MTQPTFTKRPRFILTLLGLWFGVLLLACNLTDSPGVPTIVPRATSTPPPTIGYATLAPNEFPDQATTMPRSVPQPDTTLVNLLSQVELDRLFQHIDVLTGFQTRHVLSAQNDPSRGVGAAANYIMNQFNSIRDNSYQNSFSVLPHDFTVEFNGQSVGSRNIVGVMQGTEIGGGVIILGAHYDSISSAYEDGTAYAPGANDNASGVAALIEIARIMSQRRHRATVMFIAFGAEEIQRKGSVAFVEEYVKRQNLDITAMINMDIIGSSTGPDGQVNDQQIRLFSTEEDNSRSRQLARALNLIAARHVPNMEIVLMPNADREGRYGDHMSFTEAGYPGVRFVEMLEDPTRQHTDRDTIDDIQATYLVRATQTILASVTALADGLPAPRNVSLRPAGEGMRELVWEPVPGATGYIVALRAPGGLIYDPFFEINTNSVVWEGFRSERFGSLALATKDANGLIGPFSPEFGISG